MRNVAVYMCELEGSDEKLLCRVYGKNSEYLIDREQELVVCLLTHAHCTFLSLGLNGRMPSHPGQNLVSLERVGLSPPLFGRFEVCRQTSLLPPFSDPPPRRPPFHWLPLTLQFIPGALPYPPPRTLADT